MAYQHGGHKSLSLYWSVCIDPRRGLHAAVWQPSWWCISAPYPSRVPDTLSRRDSVGERRTPRRWAHLCFFFFYVQDRSLHRLTLMAAKLYSVRRLRFTGQQRVSARGGCGGAHHQIGVYGGGGGEGGVMPLSFTWRVSTCLINLSGRLGNERDSHQPFTK